MKDKKKMSSWMPQLFLSALPGALGARSPGNPRGSPPFWLMLLTQAFVSQAPRRQNILGEAILVQAMLEA